MATTAASNDSHSQMRQMSSEFMARRKIYEQDDTHLFYTTVTKIAAARSGSPHFSNATPKPAARKAPAAAPVLEALPRVKSEESLRKRISRNSCEIRPSVPKRSSSIRSKRNHRSKDLRSLHLPNHQVFSSLDSSAGPADQAPIDTPSDSTSTQNSGRNSCSINRTSSQLSKVVSSSNASAMQDDSPLSFTLARKRTSLPSVEYKPDPRLSLLEARIAERDSCISHRDRESFLASFPQPPKTSLPRQMYAHRRNSSSQNYSLFPRSPPASETTFDKDGTRRSPRQSHEKQSPSEQLSALPQVKDEDEVTRPNTARPAMTTTSSVVALAYDHPNLSFSNPDFSDANLQLGLNPVLMGAGSDSSGSKVASEQIKFDGSQILRKRVGKKAANRWAFGSFSSDRMSFYGRYDSNHNETTDNDNNQTVQPQTEKTIDTAAENNDAGAKSYDEKHVFLKHANSQVGLRKKASSYFGLKEQTSSASMHNLLEGKNQSRSKFKKSLLKRIMCW